MSVQILDWSNANVGWERDAFELAVGWTRKLTSREQLRLDQWINAALRPDGTYRANPIIPGGFEVRVGPDYLSITSDEMHKVAPLRLRAAIEAAAGGALRQADAEESWARYEASGWITAIRTGGGDEMSDTPT